MKNYCLILQSFQTIFFVYNVTGLIRSILSSTLDVFYPNECQLCDEHLNGEEHYLCMKCRYDLPYLHDSEVYTKKLSSRLAGRVPVECITSLLDYQRGNSTSYLLRAIKYKDRPKLAEFLGEELGRKLKEPWPDLIVPVPLHPKKEHKRGYNQSYKLALGIEKQTGIPIEPKVLIRKKNTSTQTKVSKYDRFENVRSFFQLHQGEKITGKHVLLVDDVLTTGATLEACISELISAKDCRVSVATLAARI